MAKWKEVESAGQFTVTGYDYSQAYQSVNPYAVSDFSAYQMTVAQPENDPNASGIRPVQYCVLVKPDEVEKTTKGGIILPDTKVEKDEFQRMEGVLVAASPMAFTFKDWPEDAKGLRPRVGDRVIFARYNATELTGKDGAKYWLMKDEAIVGVME